MNRSEATQKVVAALPQDAAMICATGFIAREAQKEKRRDLNFYIIGSMGLASSIGLGVAMRKPNRPVVVLDGDGAVLMAMGTLAMVGEVSPKRYVHIVLDNEAYASTGNQRSISSGVDFRKVALGCGYKSAETVTRPEEIQKVLSRQFSSDGPHLLVVKINLEMADHPAPRIESTPEENARLFSEALK